MNKIQETLNNLKDRLDAVSDIEDYDAIIEEAEEVVKFADALRNFQNNELLADRAEGFLIAMDREFENFSGFAQEIAEDAVKCKEGAEQEAQEDAEHVSSMSHSSRYI